MIFFVTEQYLKSYGVITSNVDATDFSPLIQFAAKAFVKRQIGSYFFEDLLVKYNAQTLSVDEEAIVERMQLAISWRAVAHAGITLTYQLKNKGFQKQTDDNADSVELKEATFIFDHYIQQAILFEDELKEYLLTNKSLYTVYLDVLNKDSSIKNNENDPNGIDFNEGTGLMFI